MTDRELLELAAKAAGIELDVRSEEEFCTRTKDVLARFSPLTDDGDALRLAVKLKITIDHQPAAPPIVANTWTYRYHDDNMGFYEYHTDDTNQYVATRRAIVRAAAEIGKGMP